MGNRTFRVPGKRPSEQTNLSLYQELRGRGLSRADEVVAELGLAAGEGESAWGALEELGLVTRGPAAPDQVMHVTPEAALLRLLHRRQQLEEERRQEGLRLQEALELLVEHYLPAPQPGEPGVEVHVVTGPGELKQVIDDMAALAREVVSSMHPGPLPSAAVLKYSLDLDRQFIERGVRVRAVYAQRLGAAPEIQEYFHALAGHGCELRLTPIVPVDMLIADSSLALLPLDPEEADRGMAVVRGAALVRSYRAMYEHVWHHATSFIADHDAEPERLTAEQAAIVRMLAAGMKDEKIARALGVSLRTASRYISEIMQRLKANSRFEAGVRAAQLGWLDGWRL